jgi:phage terminase large subunit-like protein
VVARAAGDYVAAATKYARDIVARRIPACALTIAACQRQLDDLKRFRGKPSPYKFDAAKAERPCRFIEGLHHIKGPLARSAQRIKLEPWQCFYITTVFGWVNRNGTRRFRRAYGEIARGNAKSTLSAGIGLYMTCADGESGAECYSAATTKDQARIVFGDAKAMARKATTLQQSFGIEPLAHAIVQARSNSIFKALAAEDSSLDGLNTHFGCIDELHAHRTRGVYDVIETSTGKRDNSLLWVITTAGSNRSGICYEVRSYVKGVLEGKIVDDTQFGVIYSIDDDDDWTSEIALRKANPNWGVSVQPEVVSALLQKAIQLPSASANFKTKHLNVWVGAANAWMDMRKWDACADTSLSEDDFEGEEIFGALDLASKIDFTSRVRVAWRDDVLCVFDTHYLPEAAVERSDNAQLRGWCDLGFVQVTDGEATDFKRIEHDVLEDSKRFNLQEYGYDPWQASYLAQRCVEHGVPMIEYPQNVSTMSEPMKQLQALVYSGKLRHSGNPVLNWMMGNVVVTVDAKDNIYPRKERDQNKIDGVIALIMAVGRAFAAREAQSEPMIVRL